MSLDPFSVAAAFSAFCIGIAVGIYAMRDRCEERVELLSADCRAYSIVLRHVKHRLRQIGVELDYNLITGDVKLTRRKPPDEEG